MKALTRGAAPACLNGLRHGVHQWDMNDVPPPARAQIWTHLDQMQGGLCAYCEGSLEQLGRHIEHRCSRQDEPRRTFDWSNLYGSCDRGDCCGSFKDNKARPYHCADLLDPCDPDDDPDRYFIIRPDGLIETRQELSDRDKERALETLRVFNLNLDVTKGGRSLCAERRRVLDFYLKPNPGILEQLEELNPEDADEYVESELAATRSQPFSSIIRHFFKG